MTTLALRIDHHADPARLPEVAKALGEAFEHHAFCALRRVAYNSGGRDSRHQPKTARAVTEILRSEDCDSVLLDSGRTGDPRALAAIFTGRYARNFDPEYRNLNSYVVVPFDPAHPTEIVEGFSILASALDAFSGYICVEHSYSAARGAAFGRQLLRAEARDYLRRSKERQAHFLYGNRIETQIAGPEWGLFLGPGHLARVTPDPDVFPIIRDVGRGKLVLLSDNPEDALHEAIDARLEDARRALAPILMDVSAVPVD